MRGWLLVLLTILLAIGLPALAPNAYVQGLFTLAAVYALLALSVNLPTGYLGFLSFGHAAFFGLGGYTAALLSLTFGVNYWMAVLLAAIPGAILGTLVGLTSLRVGGAYFAITSLTVAEILRLVAYNWVDLTRGPMGLILPRPAVEFLNDLGVTFSQYYLAIAVLITGACFLLIRLLLESPTGRAWIAIRESASLAESVSIPSIYHRVENMTISGALAALAGALLVPKILVVSPELFSPLYSATALLILLVGGKGTLIGPIVGGMLFAMVPEFFRFIDEFRIPIFAGLLLVVILFQPAGLGPLFARIGRARSRRDFHPGKIKHGVTATTNAIGNGQLLLEAKDVTKQFGGLTAVRNLVFEVREGELVGLMGPNGAGKSTFIDLLSGFQKPSSGNIFFDGRAVTGSRPHEVAGRGLVRTFQHTTLFMRLSAFENALMGTGGRLPSSIASSLLRSPEFRKRERERCEIARMALSRVGLQDRGDVAAESLSYGEQRLLSVALALAAQPRLLLLDEPAAGLNPAEAERLAEVLRRLRAEGMTIILVEHNVPMLMNLCDRLFVIHHGEKIAEGTPREIAGDGRVKSAYFGED